jgi:hypothetical protein
VGEDGDLTGGRDGCGEQQQEPGVEGRDRQAARPRGLGLDCLERQRPCRQSNERERDQRDDQQREDLTAADAHEVVLRGARPGCE